MTKAEAIAMLKRIQEPEAWEPQINQAVRNFYNSKLNEKRGMAMSEYKLIKKEGYDDGYYWDTRYCFELDGKRYILVNVGSWSGYIPNHGEIMEVENDESLDILLKDWDIDKMDEPQDLAEEDAIQYVKQLKESGTKAGESFELWSDDWTTE